MYVEQHEENKKIQIKWKLVFTHERNNNTIQLMSKREHNLRFLLMVDNELTTFIFMLTK